MVPQQVSFVERSSLSPRVPYLRFHCILKSCLEVLQKVNTGVRRRKCKDLFGLSDRGHIVQPSVSIHLVHGAWLMQ